MRRDSRDRDYAADQTSREIHADFTASPEQKLAAAVVHVAIAEAGHRGLPTPDKLTLKRRARDVRDTRGAEDHVRIRDDAAALRRAELRAEDAIDFLTTNRCHGWLALMTPADVDTTAIQRRCIEHVIALRRERGLPYAELQQVLITSKSRPSVLHKASNYDYRGIDFDNHSDADATDTDDDATDADTDAA